MKFRYTMPERVGFQLAPMLDIVFLLLVFFVVTQTIALTEQDLKVKVPSADQAQNRDTRAINEIILNVRADGTVTINNIPQTKEELYSKLTRLSKLNKNQPVRIRGDGKVAYEQMVDVIDVCTKAGIYDISFSVQKRKGSFVPPGQPSSASPQ